VRIASNRSGLGPSCALTNLIGNGVACVVIGISEGEFDRNALHETMAHPLEMGEALEPGGTG
jgi:aerobic C4-dicarboxylate transport protein